MVQSSPRASTWRIARRLHVPHTRVWRTLHAEGTYHVQRVQHLGPSDFAERLEFCKWLNGSCQLHRYILFTDEKQLNCNGVNNTHNSNVWADENPHATVESNFQLRFSVNVWCVVLDVQLIGSFILEGRLTGEAYLRFLQEELPRLLEDVPLNKRGRISNMMGLLLILHVKLEIFWTVVSLGDGSGVAVPTVGQPGLQT